MYLDAVLQRPQIPLVCTCLTKITLKANKKSYLFSPRDRESTFLGEQAMHLRTIHLNNCSLNYINKALLSSE